jgi:hypothetical protein
MKTAAEGVAEISVWMISVIADLLARKIRRDRRVYLDIVRALSFQRIAITIIISID